MNSSQNGGTNRKVGHGACEVLQALQTQREGEAVGVAIIVVPGACWWLVAGPIQFGRKLKNEGGEQTKAVLLLIYQKLK